MRNAGGVRFRSDTKSGGGGLSAVGPTRKAGGGVRFRSDTKRGGGGGGWGGAVGFRLDTKSGGGGCCPT